jgi:hypothetical protein
MLEINIDGGGYTLYLSDTGNMFNLGNVIMTIKNVTLHGLSASPWESPTGETVANYSPSQPLTNNANCWAPYPDAGTWESWSLVCVNLGAKFTMKENSVITGNTTVNGQDRLNPGGVKVAGGTFIMDSDTAVIKNNRAMNDNGATLLWGGWFGLSADGGGGGVQVGWGWSNGSVPGTFIMKAGVIKGNLLENPKPSPDGPEDSGYNQWFQVGGGVYVDQLSVFTMEGGSIESNAVAWDNPARNLTPTYSGEERLWDWPHTMGGGVCLASGGQFIMKGGVIYGKDAVPASKQNQARDSDYGGTSIYDVKGRGDALAVWHDHGVGNPPATAVWGGGAPILDASTTDVWRDETLSVP